MAKEEINNPNIFWVSLCARYGEQMRKILIIITLGIVCLLISGCITITNEGIEETAPAPMVHNETVEPAPLPTIAPPAGFRLYQMPGSRIGVYIPVDWVVTEEIYGEFAILQSYPEGKYIGGEVRQPGDTKCDMRIKPPGTAYDDLVLEVKSNPNSTIISEEKVMLNSGEKAIRFEINNLGQSLFMVTDIKSKVVTLVCFGNLDRFNQMAFTLTSIY